MGRSSFSVQGASDLPMLGIDVNRVIHKCVVVFTKGQIGNEKWGNQD